MGCGKSSVGRELSGLLSLPFVDLDKYIESREGRSIRDIFESEGEEAFRKMELEALKEILLQENPSEFCHKTVSKQTASRKVNDSDKADCPDNENMILALGGGTLTTPECAELVAERTFCIYLKTSADELSRRLEHESAGRPMLNPASASEGSSHSSTEEIPGIPSEASHNNSQEKASRERLLQRITTLLSRREPIYERTARLTISTNGLSPTQIASAISKLPNK